MQSTMTWQPVLWGAQSCGCNARPVRPELPLEHGLDRHRKQWTTLFLELRITNQKVRDMSSHLIVAPASEASLERTETNRLRQNAVHSHTLVCLYKKSPISSRRSSQVHDNCCKPVARRKAAAHCAGQVSCAPNLPLSLLSNSIAGSNETCCENFSSFSE